MAHGTVGELGKQVTHQYKRDKNGSVTLVATADRTTSDNRQTWSGGSLSNFRKRRASGELLPFCAYTKLHTLELTNTCNYTTWHHGGSGSGSYSDVFTYDNGHPGVMPLITDDEMYASLGLFDASAYVQASAAKIASSGFDLLTFVAELHQVHAMWRDVGKTLINLLRRSKGSAVNSWLQYRYGWRCLYYDLLNIGKLINSLDNKRTRFKEKTGRDYTRSSTTQFNTVWISSTSHWSYEDRITCGVRGIVCAEVDVPPIQINVVVTAWELVKYSFVIDWFIQIGQWISTMTFLSMDETHYACESYALKIERNLILNSQYANPDWVVQSQTWNQKHVREVLLRVPTSIPLGLQTTLKLDSFKVADLIALVLQTLRR